MSTTEFNAPLTLSTVCGGKLEEEFQELYPAVLANLKQDDKAALNITINIKRVPETSTMISLEYKITPKFPARRRASICQETGDFKLKTEEPQKAQVLSLFSKEAKANE